jgi:hypothetical protein
MRFELEDLTPGQRIVWRQDLDGTPFEKAIAESRESIEVRASDSGSVVSLALTRKLKGTARLGALFIARGQKRELASAAAALQGVFG